MSGSMLSASFRTGTEIVTNRFDTVTPNAPDRCLSNSPGTAMSDFDKARESPVV